MKKTIIAVTFISIIYTSCVPLRSLKYLIPDSRDSAIFKNQTIQKSDNPFYFKPYQVNPAYAALKQKIDTSLIDSKTSAFIVIKNDSIIYQYLSEGTSILNKQASFSMAKSFVGTLIGIASDKGLIGSTTDLVIK